MTTSDLNGVPADAVQTDDGWTADLESLKSVQQRRLPHPPQEPAAPPANLPAVSRPSPLHAWVLVLLADVLGCVTPWAWGLATFSTAALTAGLLVAVHAPSGLYRPRLHLSVVDDLPELVARVLSATALLGLTTAALRPDVELSSVVLNILATLLSVLLWRALAYAVVRSARSSGRIGHRTLIVGGGPVGARLAETLLSVPAYGLRPVGVLDPAALALAEGRVPHLGGLADLGRVADDLDVQVLIVAFAIQPESELVDTMRTTERAGREVFVVPRLYEIVGGRSYGDHIGAVPVVRIRRRRLNRLAWGAKRAFDVVASLAALAVLAPLLVLIAAAVRLEGGPGVLFRQVRVGRDGVTFELLKFRSLKPVDENESASNWNIAQDSRLGPVGKFLRRSSLDELPQLWNIVRGEMSVVGPRPERPFFVEQFHKAHPEYQHRHRVPCGLTGLAQVNGLRGDTSIADRARYDNYYIENWSLWLDVKIICSTMTEVLAARGR